MTAFLHVQGSIKEIGSLYGQSYPTIKNRLADIANQLPFHGIDEVQGEAADLRTDVFDELKRKQIDVKTAVDRLRK